MLPSAQLLTAPTTLAHYKPEGISSTARSLLSSGLLFLHVDRDLGQKEERMAQHQHSSASRIIDDSELWFSMPSGARRERDQRRGPEQSAYHATSSRRFAAIPLISTTTDVNKPLPPEPESDKRKRKPASLRSLLRHRPSGELDPSHLQPAPYQAHQRSSSANGKLTPEPSHNYSRHHFSRSMPSSPLEYTQTSSNPATLIRAHSAAAHYPDSTPYKAYAPTSPRQQQRIDSMNANFDPSPPRTRRTFPDETPTTATPRQSVSERPRPHTWLSPTEPFQNDDEFHLFVEAMSGLPGDCEPFSPEGPPRLQGSLFARTRQNDQIPLPLRNPPSPPSPESTWHSASYDYAHSQSMSSLDSPPLVSSSALPRRDSYQQPQLSPRMNSINFELERLGISDEEAPEDELPNYAQSQAEMSARKRKEATERARELEARWNNSRGWRGR